MHVQRGRCLSLSCGVVRLRHYTARNPVALGVNKESPISRENNLLAVLKSSCQKLAGLKWETRTNSGWVFHFSS